MLIFLVNYFQEGELAQERVFFVDAGLGMDRVKRRSIGLQIELRLGARVSRLVFGLGGRVRDFVRLYHLENYLFGEVTKRFQKDGTLSAFDFFCIIIWKANRAKSKVARRLMTKGHSDLGAAVKAMLRGVSSAPDNQGRLRVMIEEWGFRLPMASAILTILYPEVFTVYDVRVCEALGSKFKNAQYKTKFADQWSQYSEYVEAVRKAVPGRLSLRDKDRYLWGKSFADQLDRDIKDGFSKPPKADDDDQLEA